MKTEDATVLQEAAYSPTAAAAPPGIWSSTHRSLTIGLVLTVSGAAFEALAVATTLPATIRDLGGLALYGWAFSAFMLANLIGITVAGALSPQRTQQHWKSVVDGGCDLFVIRGTTVSAEHVSGRSEPLNLKRFIYELDVPVIVGGAAGYTAALHLMRTGAAGVLVGFGGGAAHTTRQTLGIHAPMASAVADVAAARRDYLDESGGRYVHVIADGGVGSSGDIVKAIACGADAVMLGAALARATEAPGSGFHWGPEAHHGQLPRGERIEMGTQGSLEEILFGPGRLADGTTNIIGALRRAMATTGYSDLKEFQRVEVVVAPYQRA